MQRTQTTNFTVRLDSQVKDEAEKLFSDLGMTLSGAFNIFLHQALQVQGLPFEVRKKQPNKVTLAAMEEALMLAKDPDAKTYSSVEELKKDLDLLNIMIKKISLSLAIFVVVQSITLECLH